MTVIDFKSFRRSFDGSFQETLINTGKTVYMSIPIINKCLDLTLFLYTILQILSVTLFEKAPILQALAESCFQIQNYENDNQLMLFNL